MTNYELMTELAKIKVLVDRYVGLDAENKQLKDENKKLREEYNNFCEKSFHAYLERQIEIIKSKVLLKPESPKYSAEELELKHLLLTVENTNYTSTSQRRREYKNRFSRCLRSVLKQRRISQSDLACAVNVSLLTVDFWLRATCRPSFVNAGKLLSFLFDTGARL